MSCMHRRVVFLGVFMLSCGLSISLAEATLVGHWDFDNGVGSTDTIVMDSAGTNEFGTLSGLESLPAFVGGLNGSISALEFEVDDDHVELLGSGAESHLIGVAGATIAAWVKIPAAGLTSGTKSVVLYSRNGSATQARAALEINSGRVQGGGRGIDGGGFQSHGLASVLTADTTYFVAAALDYSASTISAYAWDGVTWQSSTGIVNFASVGGVTPATASSFVRFGERTDGGQDFIGVLDNVHVYNEALGESALKSLAGMIPEPSCATLLLCLPALAVGWRRRSV